MNKPDEFLDSQPDSVRQVERVLACGQGQRETRGSFDFEVLPDGRISSSEAVVAFGRMTPLSPAERRVASIPGYWLG